MPDVPEGESPAPRPGGSAALLVGAGIFLSRIAGLVRERAFAHYFGNGDAADVFRVALKIPNLLQNLFGEGVLSASFIPVYAQLRARGEHEEARRVAGAVFALLSLATSIVVLLGMAAAPLLVDVFTPGFEGEKREWTIHVVRILYPGVGFLVLSAWCLGILNSHRRFFLSYAAPVLWNGVIIGTLLAMGPRTSGYDLARWTAWGAFGGCVLQFLVQLPVALGLARGLKLSLGRGSESVRGVLRNFVPVVMGRGVVQVSGYIDGIIASLLPSGSLAALGYAQILYTLPVSLFGMSVSASELPEMASATGTTDEIRAKLRERLEPGLRRIAFFIVPSAAAFVAFGDLLAGLLFQTGRFGADDARYVWAILAGSALSLLAATLGRLYASAFYALHDTRTPLRFAIARVVVTTALGLLFALWLPPALGIERKWGVAGLTLSSGIAAWLEYGLLKRALGARIGAIGIPGGSLLRMWLAAAAGVAVATGARFALPESLHPALRGVLVAGPFGVTYFAIAAALGVTEASTLLRGIRRRLRV